MPYSIIALDIAHPQTLQVKMQDPESFKTPDLNFQDIV